eukprot:Nitzschia sp. Nitz4//scaffold42_size132992//70246//71889//NITZ4_003399-RA/size132992-processed-gene-0.39-mRNA-1//-1//CDS//3329551718//5693//frame0
MASTNASGSSKIVLIRLYRNLLRVAKPFTAPSPQAPILNALLNRTGRDDHISDWSSFIQTKPETDLSHRNPPRLFRRLLREVVCAGNPEGVVKSQWPSQVDTTVLWNVIRREFRSEPNCPSSLFDDGTRKQVAFMALRELGKKISYLDHLESNSPTPMVQQCAANVTPLPHFPASSYLRPGAFLLAHPHMNDSFFAKSVICILQHKEDNSGTYGIIVNRVSVNTDTGRNRSLVEAFDKSMLPGRLSHVFGDSVIREGGPVHVALQMLHSLPSDFVPMESKEPVNPVVSEEPPVQDKPEENAEKSEQEDGSEFPLDETLGGRLLPVLPVDDETSTAIHSDRATYFAGDIFQVMKAVENGSIERVDLCNYHATHWDSPCRGFVDRSNTEDVAFFVGASTWSPGQLAHEMAQGYWMPCRGPPEIALTGMCEHETNLTEEEEWTTKTQTTTTTTQAATTPSATAGSHSISDAAAAAVAATTHSSGPRTKRPLADLWLSMTSACGDEERRFAHLFFHEDKLGEYGLPCDALELLDEVDYF